MKKSGNKWKILYHQSVVKKDIPKINKGDALKIKLSIERKLSVNPVLYGIPLRGNLKQFWKIRVGDWRIVFTINKKKEVIILIIANRKDVYDIAERRK